MRNTPRYPFFAAAEITDVASGIEVKGLTSKLSLFGCGLDAWQSLQPDASVKVKLVYDDTEIAVFGKVVYALPGLSMGVAFTAVEARDERILCGWIAQLASQHSPVQHGPHDNA